MIKRKNSVFPCLAVVLLACQGKQDQYKDWKVYGGNKENNHYSSLTQVDTNNVGRLRLAWEFHTHDTDHLSQIQVNPIVIDSTLFGVSPTLKLFAVDAATGRQKWLFDPAKAVNEPKGKYYFTMNVCRGVTYYNGGAGDQRIFYAAGPKLYCIDALKGQPVASFGQEGKIDLHNDLGPNAAELFVASTTPGIIYKDLIIVGTRVAEDAGAAPGHIRAYDVHTGKLRWIFHTIPQPGEKGYETWNDPHAYQLAGGANAWAGFSLDEARGIVFAPTGSATYDFYGGKRTGDNLYANCVLALDAATGKRVWHFQTVHHDVWDRDLPTAPILVSLKKDGRTIEAVAQVTKTGFIFLLDRQTGEPVYPVGEKPVPVTTALKGEKLSATQPYPTVLKPFVRQSLTMQDLNTLVPDSSYQDIRQRLAGYVTGQLFHAPSRQGTVIFPGFDGGAEWGGPAFDPETGVLYINASEVPWVLTMIDADSTAGTAKLKTHQQTNLEAGKSLYTLHCASCHGAGLQGGGNFPSLLGLQKKYNEQQFVNLVESGRRMMPAFKQFTPQEKQALAAYLLNLKSRQQKRFVNVAKAENPYYQMPYRATGYNKFLTKEGYPAVAPPWGTLTAVNLHTGAVIWKDTLGDYPEFKAKGIHTGTENYGGAVVTAGGLVFIAATRDARLRAFNKRTGRLLWETALPAAGFATPAVYECRGKQYIVIACGGGKLQQPSGDAYMAFALP